LFQSVALLRTAVSMLGLHDPDGRATSTAGNVRKSVRLTSQVATIVAAIGRLRAGNPPVSPDPGLDHAANFLYSSFAGCVCRMLSLPAVTKRVR